MGAARRIKARGAGKSGVHFQQDKSLNKPAEFQARFLSINVFVSVEATTVMLLMFTSRGPHK